MMVQVGERRRRERRGRRERRMRPGHDADHGDSRVDPRFSTYRRTGHRRLRDELVEHRVSRLLTRSLERLQAEATS